MKITEFIPWDFFFTFGFPILLQSNSGSMNGSIRIGKNIVSYFVDSFVIENVTDSHFFQYSTVMPWENGSTRLPFLRDFMISHIARLPLNCSVIEPLEPSFRVGWMSRYALGFGFGCVDLIADCCEWGWVADDFRFSIT